MKKFIILLIFAFTACEKDDIFDDIGFYGEGTALLNGVEWKGKTGVFALLDSKLKNCLPDTCIGVLIQHYNNANELRSKILIDFVPLKLGKFQLNLKPNKFDQFGFQLDTTFQFSYHEYTSDGDVVTGYYKLINSDPDYYLNVQELNRHTGDIRGIFRARVVRDTSFIGTFPDTITIENGSFYGKINWK